MKYGINIFLISSFHNVSDRLSFISSYYMSIPCFPHLLCNVYHLSSSSLSLHSIMSLTGSPSSLLITCPYHLNIASLTFSAKSTTPHFLLISSFHNVSDWFSFISSYYMSKPSQPCFPRLLCNIYHLTSSSNLVLDHISI